MNSVLVYILSVRSQGLKVWVNVWSILSLVFLVILAMIDFKLTLPNIFTTDLITGVSLPKDTPVKFVWWGLLWLLSYIVIIWLDTLRIGGVKTLKTLPIQFRGKRPLMLLIGLPIGAFACITEQRLLEAIHPYLLNIVLVTSVGTPLLLFRPIFSLALTASTPNANPFLYVASATCFPLRVIALLDSRRVQIPSHMFGGDNLRTFEFSNWEKSVNDLMDCVGLVLLDARTASTVVSRELHWASASISRMAKTIVVTDDSGRVYLDAKPHSDMKQCPLLSLPMSIWK